MAEEIQQSFRILGMRMPHSLAFAIGGIGIVIIHPDHIGGERAVVVDVGLVVGHEVDVQVS